MRLAAQDETLADQIVDDIESATVSPAEAAMLRYARKLTLRPTEMAKSDVDALGSAGWSDTAILDICQITSYFNYVNRMADGLGVPLEE